MDIHNIPNRQFVVEEMSLPQLIQHILHNHHEYIYQQSKPTIELIDQVVNTLNEDDKNQAKWSEVAHLVNRLYEDLHNHQAKEERVLFPYIEQMFEADKHHMPLPHSCFGDICNPISMMEREHDQTTAILGQLETLLTQIKETEDPKEAKACLIRTVEELIDNVKRHIYLENELLHKKAIAMQHANIAKSQSPDEQ